MLRSSKFAVLSLFLFAALAFAQAPDADFQIVRVGINLDASAPPTPKVSGHIVYAWLLNDSGSTVPVYQFDSVKWRPVIVQNGKTRAITIQTSTEAGVAPVVYRYKSASFFTIGQLGMAVRPSFAGAGGIATSLSGTTGAGVDFALGEKFKNFHATVTVGYSFAGGTDPALNQVSFLIGKNFGKK